MPVWFIRLQQAESIILQTMLDNKVSEITPEECIEDLNKHGLYEAAVGDARLFRKDLREYKSNNYPEGCLRQLRAVKEDGYWHIYHII